MSLRIVILSVLIVHNHSQYICETAFECMNQSLGEGQYNYHAQFGGYKSAYGPSTSIEGVNIECGGALSCKSMRSIKIIMGDGYELLLCSGSYSCSETSIEITSKTSIEIRCFASNSCSFSTIRSTDTLSCISDQSCSHSYIFNLETVRADGAYSLYNATIDTMNSSSTVNIELNGAFAAYGATLICREDHICNVYCNGRTSCDFFYVDCIGECNILSTDTIAPITDIAQLDLNPIPILFDSRSITENNEELCNTQPTALTFDNYNERNSDISMISGNEGPICCRGVRACDTVNNIQYQSNGTNPIICSAERSCSNSQLYVNNGSVFCEGQGSCWRSYIYEAATVYCFGDDSCKESTITGANMVICSGSASCADSIVESAGIDIHIYFTGSHSGDGAVLNCSATDTCSINCGASDSCSSVSVYCSGICTTQCDIGSGCPVIHYINTTPIATTIPPTADPTTTSTSHSTLYPSSNPSTVPTILPSEHPTSTLYATLYPSSQPTPTLTTLHGTITSDTITTIFQDTTNIPEGNLDVVSIVVAILSVLIGILLCIILVLCVLTKYQRKIKTKKAHGDVKHIEVEVGMSDINNQRQHHEPNKQPIIYNMNAENDDIVFGDDEITNWTLKSTHIGEDDIVT